MRETTNWARPPDMLEPVKFTVADHLDLGRVLESDRSGYG